MNNKKGFTLVELLAVIIIIGVIASITIISVNKTINNSKNSLSKVQKKNIEEAAEAYYIKEGMSAGTSCVNVSNLVNNGYIGAQEVIDPKNRETMKGSVDILYQANQYSYVYKSEECKKIGKVVTADNKTLAGNIPQGNYDPGDEYIIDVDGEHEYHFYILSTEGDKVNLIMSRNICSDGTLATENNKCTVAWVSQNDYNDDTNYGNYGNNNKGPITAMNNLHEATKNWNNISNIQMNYTDEGNIKEYGYGSIITTGNITKITMKDGTITARYENLKARLPKLSELTGTGCSTTGGSCPAWMVNGLNAYISNYPAGTKEDIEEINGYWSLSSGDFSSTAAINVYSGGLFDGNSVYLDSRYGFRPVITVLKSDLS